MHHRIALAAGVLFACSASQAATAPAPAASSPTATAAAVKVAPQAPVPLAEYFKFRRFGRFNTPASFSFDERLVAYLSDEGGRLDVWVQPVGGGPARQLTRVKGFVDSIDFSPTQDLLVFAADIGGDELSRLYATDSSGKAPVALFRDDPQGTRSEFAGWAEDGRTFLYTSSRRDPKFLDLYEYDVATRRSRLLWKASGKLAFALPSRDHRQFVIIETNSDADSNLYLLGRGTKAPVLLTPHQGEINHAPTSFSPDGKKLYFTSDEGGEFTSLRALDLATRRSEIALQDVCDVEQGEYSRGWRYFFTVANADGSPKVAVHDARSGNAVRLPAIAAPGPVLPVAFSKTDRFLVARLQTDVAPRSLWLVDLKAGTARDLVEVAPPSLKGRRFVAGEPVKMPSFDGKPIPAFLYRPEGQGPFPALLDIHGGPTAQSRRDFSPWRQYLVSKGYVVLVPNVRGSTGYGKGWTKLDNKDLGGGPLKDVVAAKQWLVANAGVSADRVVIMGGSYGGYMTLAAATFAPLEFAAHVDIFGVSDLKSLVESFPPYWASMSTYIYQKFGNPNEPVDAQYQHDRSPLYFVDRIQRPLLVIQGTNDARVKKDQSDRIVAALRGRGVPVDYLVIEGEGHGFSRTENLRLALETSDRFLDRYLFGDTRVQVVR
jgi:dipeptidyl aminopeptidase/acylaminoacyl peptidase